MKRKLISFITLVIAISGFSLPVRYSYDAAGNRVRREIVVSSSPSLSPKKQTTYTDNLSEDYKVKLHYTGNSQIRVEVIALGNIPEGTLEVYSASGIKVLATTIEQGNALVDLGSHRNGVYVLNINIDGEQTSWKITKK